MDVLCCGKVEGEMKQWSAGSKETSVSLSSLEVGFGARPMLRHGATSPGVEVELLRNAGKRSQSARELYRNAVRDRKFHVDKDPTEVVSCLPPLRPRWRRRPVAASCKA